MKAAFIVGAATGYVLGAKAGRERYEQIRKAARRVAQNPAVQSAAGSARTQAGDLGSRAAQKAGELGSMAAQKTNDLAGSAKQKVNGKLHREHDDELV
ncbi:MAG: YtxH domain-containing protein [Streptosporangiaceae bacterium]